MLGHSPFYNKALKKVVAVFGKLFSDVAIVRRDSGGNEVERIHVPIQYGPKEKYITRPEQDEDLQRAIAIKVPRMSFQIASIVYDGARKRNKIRKFNKLRDEEHLDHMFDGVPYKLGIDLTIISKNQDDANQILEQILPFFTPDYSPTYNPVEGFDFKEDIPITLQNISYSDNYDDDWRTRRNVLYTLNFQLFVYFYGPVKEQGVIKKAIVDIHIAPGDQPVTDEEIKTSPRVVRFTTVPDPIDANADDNYGYTETTEEFFDGKIRFPDGTDKDPPLS